MAKRPAYKSEKRKKEIERQKKQELKRQKRLSKGVAPKEGEMEEAGTGEPGAEGSEPGECAPEES